MAWTGLVDRPTTSLGAITTLTGVEEAELDRRVREIMAAWIDRWDELSPKHQATFLEAVEFRELALIPKEFGLEAINGFQERGEILREAKRLQNERETRQKNTPRRRTARRRTNRPRQRRRDSTPSNNDPYWSASFGHRPRGRPTAMAEGKYSRCPGCDRLLTADGRCNNPTCN